MYEFVLFRVYVWWVVDSMLFVSRVYMVGFNDDVYVYAVASARRFGSGFLLR